MKQKQRLHFKLNSTNRRIRTLERDKSGLQQLYLNPLHSQRLLNNINQVQQKVQTVLQEQNSRLENIENKYNEAMLSRFDKLININYKIGKNLERIVKRLEKQEKEDIKPDEISLANLFPEPKPKKQFKQLRIITSKKISKCEEEKEMQQVNLGSKEKNQGEIQEDGWDRNTIMNVEQHKNMNIAQPVVNAMLQNFNLQSPRHLKKSVASGQTQQFTNIFRTMVEFQFSDQAVNSTLNKLLGTFYHKTAEFYYLEYSSGRIKYEDMKIKFSSDILNHAIEMCQKWIEYAFSEGYDQIRACNFKKQNFFKIFDRAAVNTLQYLIHKYPPTRTKLIDSELSERIQEIKSFSLIKYDLLRNANMEFGVDQGQTDFTKDIKRWLNCLIKQSKSQFPLFRQTMKRIFTNNQGSLDGTKADVDSEYTICSKISEHTRLYTQQQIKAPGLEIRNPQILRILIKWFQELLSYFLNAQEKIHNNKYGFKSTKHRSIPVKLPYSRQKVLINHLKRIYETSVKPFIQQQQTNIGSIMQLLIGISIGGIEGYEFLNQREATITKLAQNFYETFKSYMVIFINGILQNLAKIREEYQLTQVESTLNLISFTISDLLRCSCTGTKPQIYRIYNQILQNKDYFEVIRVKNKLNEPTRNILINLKLKDSFLICEVQLSLGSIQEEVNDHFCHYLYQLERSKLGVLFECASQIANLDPRIAYLKKHKDLKFKQSNVIKQRFQNKIRVNGSLYCSSVHEQVQMILTTSISPYCCFKCNSYIQGYRVRLPYMQCPQCRITICTECIGMITKQDRSVMTKVFEHPSFNQRIIPPQFFQSEKFVFLGQYSECQIKKQIYQGLQKINYVVLFGAGSTEIFTLVYKQYKQIIIETFATLLEIPQSESSLNTQEGKVLCCMVPLLKAQKRKLVELQNYMKYHASLQWYQLQQILNKNNITEVICVVSEETKSVFIVDIEQSQMQINESRIHKGILRRIKRANKFNQNWIQITSYGIKQIGCLSKIQNKPDITSINLWENKIEDISILSGFKNVTELYLQDNQISSLDAILHLNKIVLLGVGDNKIVGSLPILKMPNLQFVVFSNNKFTNVDNLALSSIPNITLLKLSQNPIRSVPQLNFLKLEVLALNHCKIYDLTQLAKSHLPSLLYLILNDNQISGGLVRLCFPNLLILTVYRNKIFFYADFIKSQLPKLNKLDLHQNMIQQSLCELNFPSLKQINLESNNIRYLCQQLLQSKKLSQINNINLSRNKLKGKLPIFKLHSLKTLFLGHNQIMDISSLEISQFDFLQQLILNNNIIESKLPRLNFKRLKLIDFSHNFISDATSLKAWKGPNIQTIRLNNNVIESQIPIIQLYGLKLIDLSNNRIKFENFIDNMHLTPVIEKINLEYNPPQLKQNIILKYKDQKSVMSVLEL